MPNTLNAAALALNSNGEACRLKAYDDKTGATLLPGQKAKGTPSIGYGHTGVNPFTGKPVASGDVWTQQQADQVHRNDLLLVENVVASHVLMPINDNQYGALVDFAFNVGLGAFLTSGVLRAVNAGDRDKVPDQLMLWVRAGGRKVAGLVTRRQNEVSLWNTRMEAEPVPPVVSKQPLPPLTPDKPGLVDRAIAWLEGKSRIPQGAGAAVIAALVLTGCVQPSPAAALPLTGCQDAILPGLVWADAALARACPQMLRDQNWQRNASIARKAGHRHMVRR